MHTSLLFAVLLEKKYNIPVAVGYIILQYILQTRNRTSFCTKG